MQNPFSTPYRPLESFYKHVFVLLRFLKDYYEPLLWFRLFVPLSRFNFSTFLLRVSSKNIKFQVARWNIFAMYVDGLNALRKKVAPRS